MKLRDQHAFLVPVAFVPPMFTFAMAGWWWLFVAELAIAAYLFWLAAVPEIKENR